MASVIGKNEILLNSERYKINGPVRKTLVSIAAPRFTIGDTQRGADPRASILTQNDFRGGIGSVVLIQGLLSLHRTTFVAV